MQLDCLIIGQGICGTFLSYELEKAGLSFIVIDEARAGTASRSAAGLINPVTGRRMVRTWMIEDLLPFALHAYDQIGNKLGISCISQLSLIDFFPTPQMRLAFLKRFEESQDWLFMPKNENDQRDFFNYDFGYGEVNPCCLVDMNQLLPTYRKYLLHAGTIREEKFLAGKLKPNQDSIEYEDISAKKIIFCDGVAGFSNSFFNKLPFAPNKGEALLIEIDHMPSGHVYKKGLSLVPWQKNIFWVGSSYEWEFKDELPSQGFREKTESLLRQWLKPHFKVLDHYASVRPATLERRPFVGFHPLQPQVGILNGMGTKGCSLAPYFAAQLTANMVSDSPIHKEANIKRYEGILGKKSP